MKRIAALMIGLTIFAATPGLAQSTAPRKCLRFGEIYSWKVLDPKTVIVQDNGRNRFKMSLMSYCPGLAYRDRIGFRSRGSFAVSCVTAGDELVVNQFGTGAQRCPIISIAPYTPAMEAADKVAAPAKRGSQ